MGTFFSIAAGAVLSGAAGAAAAAYLERSLRPILVELCGTEPRAAFWLAFSDLMLVLAPVVFALLAADLSSAGARAVFIQFRWGTFGLLVTAGTLGLAMGSFIREGKR